MGITAHSTIIQARLKYVETKAAKSSTLWDDEVADVSKILYTDINADDTHDVQNVLNAIHRLNRLDRIFHADQENNQGFYDALQETPNTLWEEFADNPASLDLQKKLATMMYKAKAGGEDVVLINAFQQYRLIVPMILEKCIADGNDFDISFGDGNFNNLLHMHCEKNDLLKLAQHYIQYNIQTNRRIILDSNLDTDGSVRLDKDKRTLFYDNIKPFLENRRQDNNAHWVLTRVPSPTDAEIDNISFNDYVQLFFEMADQPWDHISKQQLLLIDELNAAKDIRFTNNDGTDISMSIDGFTFANSVIWRNVPGAEAFSAPHRESAEGRIMAKGKFNPKDGIDKLIENITMDFKNGRVINAHADTHNDHFQKLLDEETDNRYIGELGIGTNPHLKRAVANTILVEKISGSFHVALGAAFTSTEYQGTPVKFDNGNRGSIHWDITTLLYGKDGIIELDGLFIMRDGIFVDGDKYNVLNNGWAAIPKDQRPEYWKDYFDRDPITNRIRLGKI